MEVYKTTVNAYKRLLEDPVHGEVCGVPTLVGTKTRKVRVRATAVVESNGNSCKLLCMPHAGMASDVDVVRVAPGDGTVVGNGGVSIRTNAEHINSEFLDGEVKGRLVAAKLCVSNISSQSNGVLYAACDQNRVDISGYEPVDIVTSIKEGNMVVASAQDEKVTVLYKPSKPEEIDEWVEDVQEGPYGGTRDINGNSYPASHIVIWQGNNNSADYERPSGEQLTAYEAGTNVTLYGAGTSRSDLYLAGPSVEKLNQSSTVKQLSGSYYANDNTIGEGRLAVDNLLKFACYSGTSTGLLQNEEPFTIVDYATMKSTGYQFDAADPYNFIIAFCSPKSVSQLQGLTWSTFLNTLELTGWAYDDLSGFKFRLKAYRAWDDQSTGYVNGFNCSLRYDGGNSTYVGGGTLNDAFAVIRISSPGKQTAVAMFVEDFNIYDNLGNVATSGNYNVKLTDFATYGLVPYWQRGILSTLPSADFWDVQVPTQNVERVDSKSTVTQIGPQEILTQQGASVDVVQQPAQPFEYSAEIQTVNVPQRLLVEFDAVYEYSGEKVLNSVTANPMRGKKDILPGTHNNVFASPLSGNQREYRRYDLDSARGSSKRKSMK